MALHFPVMVEFFDKDDKIISPVTRPISITCNFDAYSFGYIAIQMETYDPLGLEIIKRFAAKEHVQYRVQGRFGVETGDVNSIYSYSDGKGETTIYGRSHHEILRNVLGYPNPGKAAESQTSTHAYYTGSELSVMRRVLTDNFVNRLGGSMQFQQGDLGQNVTIDFRFDEVFAHWYEDSFDRGGIEMGKKGGLVFSIVRDFENRRYVLSARAPKHHPQLLTPESGILGRWQLTGDRGEASRVVVGGPGEMLQRVFVTEEGALANRRHHAEMFYEDTSPDTGERPEGQDPLPSEVAAAMRKSGRAKLDENGPKAGIGFTVKETEGFHIGGGINVGDYVKLGLKDVVDFGEVQLVKGIATWTNEGGYEAQLSDTDFSETVEQAQVTRVARAIRDLSTRTRRV